MTSASGAKRFPAPHARMALSPEEETAIERMSRSLVDKLLRGPISEVITCAESGTSPQDQRGPEEPD